LERAQELGGGRYHVILRGAHHGAWEAELAEDRPNEKLVIRHLGEPKEQIAIYFAPAPPGRGTEIKVVVDLGQEKPGALLRRALTAIAGDDPDRLLKANLRRLKMLLEAGEIVTVEGQPSGRDPERVTLPS
jgi:uncharacterized membrane protein